MVRSVLINNEPDFSDTDINTPDTADTFGIITPTSGGPPYFPKIEPEPIVKETSSETSTKPKKNE